MSNHNEISSFIWNVCDDVLRGLFKQHEYGDVILPFLVLRRLDCVIEPKKDEIIELYNELKDEVDPTPIIKKQTGLKFFNHSNYDLQRLKGDPNGLKVNFPNYINGFSQNVFDILENFQLSKPVEKLLKNNKLYLLIDKFTEIDLHPNKIDNHMMGQIFEELLRKFSEMSNETSGEHYTPRDVVNLLVSLVFSEGQENLKGNGIIRSIFDPCCGTGGMLTIGKEWVEKNIDNKVRLNLYGQELNPHTYSICKSDMLISGENPDNVKLGSSLSEDHFEGKKFDYMISNPPFGVSWKSEKEFIEEESKNPYGRFSVGIPRTSDGSLLFLQHLVSKMKEEGSKIGIVFNYSPLYSGNIGGGEHEIRKWLLEKDLIEMIIELPDQLFFNTPITTFIWILNNKKENRRKGKIQLINGVNQYNLLRKKLNEKRKEITNDNMKNLIETYQNFQENKISKIYPNKEFFCRKLKVVRNDNFGRKQNKDESYEYIKDVINIEEFLSKNDLTIDKKYDITKKENIGVEINFSKYFFNYEKPTSTKTLIKNLLDLDNKLQKV